MSMSYSEMSEATLYELLEQFGVGSEWADQYSRYFKPYDPTQEMYIKEQADLKRTDIMSGMEQDLATVSNITGSAGFASSYQGDFLAGSVLREGTTKVSDIDRKKSQQIYQEQKQWAEDFYDTVIDLSKLGTFDFDQEQEDIIMAGSTDIDDMGGIIIDDPQVVAAECAASGGMWLNNECVYFDEDGEGICYNQAGAVVDCESSECIAGPCGSTGGGSGGGGGSLCPYGYIWAGGGCIWDGVTDLGDDIDWSDARLKENIYHVGEEKGLNIYEFNYKDTKYGEGRFTGVMAQELLQTSYRNAVHFNDDGYMVVDYAKLPVKMKKVE